MTQYPQTLRVFLCHSSDDKEAVRKLYKQLQADGYDPWLDEDKLLAGHNWEREIAAAVRGSDVVLVCLSRDSINKRGYIQKEIKYALDVAEEQPEGSVFIIPLKLEECGVPGRLSHLQWVNLFDERGYEKLLTSLRAKSGTPAGGGQTDEHTDEHPAQEEGGNRRRGRRIWRELFKGLLCIALVIAAKVAVERTASGKRLDLMSYDLLHIPLTADNVPVAVVDISDKEPEDVSGRPDKATPRKWLREMIEALAAHEPKAIGIVIDFSPEYGNYIDPRDPEFFRFCLDMRREKNLPIFLGVDRTVTSRSPAAWLKGEEYAELAVNLRIPNDTRRMLSEINVTGAQQAERAAAIKAISFALAESYGPESGYPDGALQRLRGAVVGGLRRIGFIEQISENTVGPGLTLEDFPVDFSQLESVESETVRTINPVALGDQSQRRRFEGKVVLLGAASLGNVTDVFPVPGRDRPYAGIFLHACAAYTLIKAPRYDVTGAGRAGIDIFFALALLSALILIRLHYERSAARWGASERLRGAFTLLVMLAAVVAGVVFVRATRVMWNDFVSALAVVIFHPTVERGLERWSGWLKKNTSALLRLVFKW